MHLSFLRRSVGLWILAVFLFSLTPCPHSSQAYLALAHPHPWQLKGSCSYQQLHRAGATPTLVSCQPSGLHPARVGTIAS